MKLTYNYLKEKFEKLYPNFTDEFIIEIFNYQYLNVPIYKEYLDILKINPLNIRKIEEIIYLPIRFFKTNKIYSTELETHQKVFYSSGTGSKENLSKHYIYDLNFYLKNAENCFEEKIGNIKDYTILSILPSYLEQENSSLIEMVKHFNKKANFNSKIYHKNYSDFYKDLIKLQENNNKIIILGVSYALLDLSESYKLDLKNVVVMETGGMKGKREEITKEQMHKILTKNFNKQQIYSEYGMTELQSQCYSKGYQIFETSSSIRINIRDINDPFNILENNKRGGINIIDIANISSCSFIETEDLGIRLDNFKFKILGRINNENIRGCNSVFDE